MIFSKDATCEEKCSRRLDDRGVRSSSSRVAAVGMAGQSGWIHAIQWSRFCDEYQEKALMWCLTTSQDFPSYDLSLDKPHLSLALGKSLDSQCPVLAVIGLDQPLF